jgi:hypothetical protein
MLFTDNISDAITGKVTRAYLENYGGDRVVFDVVISFVEEDNTDITEFAIEASSPEDIETLNDDYVNTINTVTDNAISKPKTINIKAILTDDAFILQQALGAASSMATGGSANNMFQYIPDRMARIQEWLMRKEILSYNGQDGLIESLVLSKVTRTKDQSTGNGMAIDVSLKQILIVDVQTTDKPTFKTTKPVNMLVNGKMSNHVPSPLLRFVQ